MILQGYINTHKAYTEKSFLRGELGDRNLKRSSSVLLPISGERGVPLQRASTDAWGKATIAAEQCRETFKLAFRQWQNKDKARANQTAETALSQLKAGSGLPTCVEPCSDTVGCSVAGLDLDDGLDEVEKYIEDWRLESERRPRD